MRITDKQRSMIASAFVGAFQFVEDRNDQRRDQRIFSLCCSADCVEACARIVGKRAAKKLQRFFYEDLGCGGYERRDRHDEQEQYFLDKISCLESL